MDQTPPRLTFKEKLRALEAEPAPPGETPDARFARFANAFFQEASRWRMDRSTLHVAPFYQWIQEQAALHAGPMASRDGAFALECLGSTYRFSPTPEKAVAWYREGLRRYGRDPDGSARMEAAECGAMGVWTLQRDLRRFDEAIELNEEVIEAFRDDSDPALIRVAAQARIQAAWIRVEAGDDARGAALWEALLEGRTNAPAPTLEETREALLNAALKLDRPDQLVASLRLLQIYARHCALPERPADRHAVFTHLTWLASRLGDNGPQFEARMADMMRQIEAVKLTHTEDLSLSDEQRAGLEAFELLYRLFRDDPDEAHREGAIDARYYQADLLHMSGANEAALACIEALWEVPLEQATPAIRRRVALAYLRCGRYQADEAEDREHLEAAVRAYFRAERVLHRYMEDPEIAKGVDGGLVPANTALILLSRLEDGDVVLRRLIESLELESGGQQRRVVPFPGVAVDAHDPAADDPGADDAVAEDAAPIAPAGGAVAAAAVAAAADDPAADDSPIRRSRVLQLSIIARARVYAELEQTDSAWTLLREARPYLGDPPDPFVFHQWLVNFEQVVHCAFEARDFERCLRLLDEAGDWEGAASVASSWHSPVLSLSICRGYCHYGLETFDRARETFRAILDRFHDPAAEKPGRKLVDALFMLGLIRLREVKQVFHVEGIEAGRQAALELRERLPEEPHYRAGHPVWQLEQAYLSFLAGDELHTRALLKQATAGMDETSTWLSETVPDAYGSEFPLDADPVFRGLLERSAARAGHDR